MADSLLGIDKRCIFRETFESEQSVRKNGGTPTYTTFDKGSILNTSVVGGVSYRYLLNGTYSIRIRLKVSAISVSNRYLFGSSSSGVFIRIANSAIVIEVSSGTRYVNGVATNAISFSEIYSDIIVSGMSFINIPLWTINNTSTPDGGGTDVSISLLEIYSGTLTADEVKNLYENKRHKDLVPNHDEQLGPELCINGGFDTASNWVMGPNGSIANGVATLHSFENNYQSEGNFAGKLIKFTIKMVYDYPDSTTIWDNLNLLGTIPNTIGYHSIYVRPIETTAFPNIISQGNITIDDVSFKEVLVPTVREILNVSAVNGVIRNKYSGESYINLIPQAASNFTTDGTSYWSVVQGTISWNSNGWLTLNSTINAFIYAGALTVWKQYYFSFKARSFETTGIIYMYWTTILPGQYISISLTNEWQTASGIVSGGLDTAIYLQLLASGVTIQIDDIIIKEVIPSITNTAVSVVKENDVYAMKFDGATSRLIIGSYDTLVGNKTSITWFKAESPLGTYPTLFSNGRLACFIGHVTKKIMFYSQYSQPSYSNPIALRVWNQLCITRTSLGIDNIYVNGNFYGEVVDDTAAGAPVAGTRTYELGSDNGVTSFRGLISSHRIIDGILTAQEIAQLYSDEKDKYGL